MIEGKPSGKETGTDPELQQLVDRAIEEHEKILKKEDFAFKTSTENQMANNEYQADIVGKNLTGELGVEGLSGESEMIKSMEGNIQDKYESILSKIERIRDFLHANSGEVDLEWLNNASNQIASLKKSIEMQDDKVHNYFHIKTAQGYSEAEIKEDPKYKKELEVLTQTEEELEYMQDRLERSSPTITPEEEDTLIAEIRKLEEKIKVFSEYINVNPSEN